MALVAILVVGAAALVIAHPAGANASLPSAPAAAPAAAVAASPSATTVVSLPTATTPALPSVNTPASSPSPTVAADGAVLTLQRKLAALGYDVGAIDGQWGERTSESVLAFQKVEGLARTGQPGPEVTHALATATPPHSLVPGGASTRIEIDLRRQVLLFWDQGRLARILPVSTGSGQRYCVAGSCELAVTPKGTFHIYRKVVGLDPGPLGPLYFPMYFTGGIAIHGEPSVPTSPASHGCARIPMYAAAALYAQVPSGTAVYVV